MCSLSTDRKNPHGCISVSAESAGFETYSFSTGCHDFSCFKIVGNLFESPKGVPHLSLSFLHYVHCGECGIRNLQFQYRLSRFFMLQNRRQPLRIPERCPTPFTLLPSLRSLRRVRDSNPRGLLDPASLAVRCLRPAQPTLHLICSVSSP